MSEKLVKQLADAGLSSLHAVLEHLGILTFSCDSVAWESVFFSSPHFLHGSLCQPWVRPRRLVACRRGLGKLNAEELKDTCDRLKAVGFGPGHTCGLRMLCSAAVT